MDLSLFIYLMGFANGVIAISELFSHLRRNWEYVLCISMFTVCILVPVAALLLRNSEEPTLLHQLDQHRWLSLTPTVYLTLAACYYRGLFTKQEAPERAGEESDS